MGASGSAKFGDWGKAERFFGAFSGARGSRVFDKHFGRGLQLAGLKVEAHAKAGIRKQRSGWAALSSLTVDRKGSSKALFDRGDLIGGIKSTRVKSGLVFVGVLRKEKDRNGGQLVDIAAVHEHGATITPKRAQALFIPLTREARPNMGGLERGVDFVLAKVVNIPARPFMAPALKDAEKEFPKIFQEAGKAALNELLR